MTDNSRHLLFIYCMKKRHRICALLQIMIGKLTGHIVQFYCETHLSIAGSTLVYGALFAYAFRVTWSKRVFEVQPFVSDTSPKCIDREGLGRHRTGLGKNTL